MVWTTGVDANGDDERSPRSNGGLLAYENVEFAEDFIMVTVSRSFKDMMNSSCSQSNVYRTLLFKNAKLLYVHTTQQKSIYVPSHIPATVLHPEKAAL